MATAKQSVTDIYAQIITDLKNKVYHPVYFLMGEEPFYIDKISDYIEDNVLDETEKEFNQTVLYGLEVDVPTIVSVAKRFPMMSNYQVVIVKEAQNIRKIEELQPYAEKPLASTILVLCYKYEKLDKRKSLAKSIEKNGVLFESEKIKDYQVEAWIKKYLNSLNYEITPKALNLLAEYLGNDLSKIANEIGKLTINVPAKTEITADHIEQNIGISKDFNIFELQKALGEKNIFKANQIVNYFISNPKDNPFVLTVTNLYSYFTKVLVFHSLQDKSKNNVASELGVNPYFVKDYEIAAKNYTEKKLFKIFSYLRLYDVRSKGVDNASTGEGELLKEMVFKILH